MVFSLKLHETIVKHNCLSDLTQQVKQYLLRHPTHYKVVLLANHFFRTAAMAVFMGALPFSPVVNTAICFGGSLFYRLTVENNCAYKFALPAFAGAVAFPIAQTGISQLTNGVALGSLSTLFSLIPLSAYLSYVVLTVDYDVDAHCRN